MPLLIVSYQGTEMCKKGAVLKREVSTRLRDYLLTFLQVTGEVFMNI